MGMLDKLAYNDAEESFPNFDYSYGFDRSSSLQLNQVSTNNSTSSASSTSSSSSYTSSSRDSYAQLPRVALDAPASSGRRSSKSPNSRRHAPTPRRTRTAEDRKALAVKESRRKSADFDLGHEDEELQEAESYLYWCETCLRHCDVPSHRSW